MRARPAHLLDHREFPVLYVDDEPENLRIFELTFRREFSILTASSAEEGLELLNGNPVAVVLSDHKMPHTTGVEFLTKVNEVDPLAMRILVTAYGDAETLGDAINGGQIHRYVAKPWEPDQMRAVLRQAIESYALDREREALLGELTVVNQLSRAMHSELDTERLVELLLNALHHDLGFDGASLLLCDGSKERLRWAGTRPTDEVGEHIQQIVIDTSTAPEFIARIQAGAAQLLDVSRADEFERPIREWVTEVSAGSVLAVPLVGETGVLGVLAVDNRRGGRQLGSDERTMLDGLGTQAVIALENAHTVEDLRRSRMQVARADRLGTLGTLAAGLAHEINNPLVSVQTFLSLAPEKRDSEDPEFWDDYHELACREMDRIRDLIATMSRLSRIDGDERVLEQVDPLALASDALRLVEQPARKLGIECVLESLLPEKTMLLGVRNQLHQVLLNLLLNAVHASQAGGRVTLRVGCESDAAGSHVRFEVEDTGQGIPEADLERVFDPFFTTKDPEQGTGLGLMISDRIVSDHDGTIDVRSRVGEGTRFCVRIPDVNPR